MRTIHVAGPYNFFRYFERINRDNGNDARFHHVRDAYDVLPLVDTTIYVLEKLEDLPMQVYEAIMDLQYARNVTVLEVGSDYKVPLHGPDR